jgi:hypothetical protein
MDLTGRPLSLITKQDIESLVSDEEPEGDMLDFKGTVEDSMNTAFKRGLVTDAVAFANTRGGLIAFGVKERRVEGEKTNVATGPLGFNHNAPEMLKDKLLAIIRDRSEPNLSNCEGRVFGEFEEGSVVLIRVPRSIFGPHRVKDEGHFFGRQGAGNYPMDWRQIRDGFSQREGLLQRLDQWRWRRATEDLPSGRGPVFLSSKAFALLHVVPASFFDPGFALDLAEVKKCEEFFPPLTDAVRISRFNFEGMIVEESGGPGERGLYTQIFRNGAVEAASVHFFRDIPMPEVEVKRWVHAEPLQGALGCLGAYLKGLHRLGIDPPFFVMLTLTCTRGCGLYFPLGPLGVPFHHDILAFPPAIVEEHGKEPEEILKVTLDTLWQTAGREKYFKP